MNRGSDDSRIRVSNGGTRFNEAPIHESGKSGQDAARHRHHDGFNEAPIHESGKFRIEK